MFVLSIYIISIMFIWQSTIRGCHFSFTNHGPFCVCHILSVIKTKCLYELLNNGHFFLHFINVKTIIYCLHLYKEQINNSRLAFELHASASILTASQVLHSPCLCITTSCLLFTCPCLCITTSYFLFTCPCLAIITSCLLFTRPAIV